MDAPILFFRAFRRILWYNIFIMMNLEKEKVIINGELIDSASLDNVLDVRDPYAYEVIRLIDGTPLFLQEHYTRLTRTLRIMKHEPPLRLEELRALLLRLADACRIRNDNAKLMINGWDEAGNCNVYLTYLNASYPDASLYRDGIRTDLIQATRSIPQAKIGDLPLRLRTNEFIRANGLFEAIMVDGHGNITEGSRSNVFFIRNEVVYTTPSGGVLPGITRQKIFDLCRENDIPLVELAIASDHIGDFDAAFISGTSPKVLPIRTIGSTLYAVGNPLLRRLMKLYDAAIEQDIRDRSQEGQ